MSPAARIYCCSSEIKMMWRCTLDLDRSYRVACKDDCVQNTENSMDTRSLQQACFPDFEEGFCSQVYEVVVCQAHLHISHSKASLGSVWTGLTF
jgi:hypothetical protein